MRNLRIFDRAGAPVTEGSILASKACWIPLCHPRLCLRTVHAKAMSRPPLSWRCDRQGDSAARRISFAKVERYWSLNQVSRRTAEMMRASVEHHFIHQFAER
jgi:hypothetical protein